LDHELTKKGVKKKLFVVKSRLLVKERGLYIGISDIRGLQKTEKMKSMIKNKVVRSFWAVKWTFFLKTGHSKIWSVKFFLKKGHSKIWSVPPKLGAKSPPMNE